MSTDARKALTFMGAGIAVALLLGLLVWQLNSPTREGDAGEVTQPAATGTAVRDNETPIAEAESSSYPGAASTPPSGDASQQSAESSADPYLPPNAVVNNNVPYATPTRIVRPTTIVGQSPTPQYSEPEPVSTYPAETTAEQPQPETTSPSQPEIPISTQLPSVPRVPVSLDPERPLGPLQDILTDMVPESWRTSNDS